MRIRGKVSPMARPASICVSRNGLQRAADDFAHMRPAENREREKPRFNRRQIDAGKGQEIEGGQDQHQHRNAPDAIDSRTDRQAQRPLAIGKANAGKEADDAAATGWRRRRFPPSAASPAPGPSGQSIIRGGNVPSRPASELREAAFELPQPRGNQQAGREIKHTGRGPGLRHAERLGVQLARLIGQFRNGDHGGKRRILEQGNESRAQSRQAIAPHDGRDDIERQLKAGKADGAARIDDATRNAGKPARKTSVR